MKKSDYSGIKSFLTHMKKDGLTKDSKDAATAGLIMATALEKISNESVCTCLNGFCAWHTANEVVSSVNIAVNETSAAVPTKYSEYDDGN
jgi:hypothetical protein